MKIAYVVDVHGQFEAVPRVLETVGAVDLLVVGGDITTGGTPDEAERALVGWRRLAPRLLAVAGNMDSPAIDARLAELDVGLDGRGFAFEDVGVFGVSAAPIPATDTLRARRRGTRATHRARLRRRQRLSRPDFLPACAAARNGLRQASRWRARG